MHCIIRQIKNRQNPLDENLRFFGRDGVEVLRFREFSPVKNVFSLVTQANFALFDT